MQVKAFLGKKGTDFVQEVAEAIERRYSNFIPSSDPRGFSISLLDKVENYLDSVEEGPPFVQIWQRDTDCVEIQPTGRIVIEDKRVYLQFGEAYLSSIVREMFERWPQTRIISKRRIYVGHFDGASPDLDSLEQLGLKAPSKEFYLSCFRVTE